MYHAVKQLFIDACLQVGLSAVISPSDAFEKGVSWSSSNDEIATVNSAGLVTAISEGEATITVTSDDGDFSDQCLISVARAPVNVDGIVINDCPTEPLIIENTHQLNFEISPANADDKSVSWSSSNDEIATVNSAGLVTAISEGKATITVTTNNGNLTDHCVFNIEKPTVYVTDLTLTNCPDKALNVDSTHQLSAIISPVNATDQSVIWSSDDTSVATVSENGLITAVSPGDATITVMTTDGLFIDRCDITVNPSTVNIFSIDGNNDQLTIYPNPVSNRLFIKFPNIDDNREIRILNSIGQLIYHDNARKLNKSINMEVFNSNGFITVQIISGNNVSVFKKIIITK